MESTLFFDGGTTAKQRESSSYREHISAFFTVRNENTTYFCRVGIDQERYPYFRADRLSRMTGRKEGELSVSNAFLVNLRQGKVVIVGQVRRELGLESAGEVVPVVCPRQTTLRRQTSPNYVMQSIAPYICQNVSDI